VGGGHISDRSKTIYGIVTSAITHANNTCTSAEEVIKLCYHGDGKRCLPLDFHNTESAESSDQQGEVGVWMGGGGDLRHTGRSTQQV